MKPDDYIVYADKLFTPDDPKAIEITVDALLGGEFANQMLAFATIERLKSLADRIEVQIMRDNGTTGHDT